MILISESSISILLTRLILEKDDKEKLSETDICDLFITPAIKDAGWDQMRQIRRGVTITTGYDIVGFPYYFERHESRTSLTLFRERILSRFLRARRMYG